MGNRQFLLPMFKKLWFGIIILSRTNVKGTKRHPNSALYRATGKLALNSKDCTQARPFFREAQNCIKVGDQHKDKAGESRRVI